MTLMHGQIREGSAPAWRCLGRMDSFGALLLFSTVMFRAFGLAMSVAR